MKIPKPKSLTITEENGVLVGTDTLGYKWTIRWCGNGQYSHWSLNEYDKYKQGIYEGWYEYTYNGPEYEREAKSSLLEKQIREAEHKYRIYT